MKKLICFLLTALLVLSLSAAALAAEVTLEETATMDGMGKSWYQGYTPAVSYHTMTLCLPLKVPGAVGDITVSIALDDPDVFLLDGQPKTVTVAPKDGLYPVKLSIPLERTRRNGDYPATVTVRGTDEAGKEITETMPYVIRIRDGYSSHETMEPVITDVVTELNVGSDGTVTLTITNPTTTQSITDGTLTLTDAGGDILMSGSNRVSLPEILPGKSETVTVPVVVKGNASIAPHTLEVTLNGKVMGTATQWKENFTVSVTQAIRLEQGGAQLPAAIAGELGTMTLPLMNMGKGTLSNVLVKLEMEGVIDAQSVLVGTMEAGESKSAKLTFTPKPDSVGTHSGTVTITCEDAYGNAFSQTLEVTLTVDEPIPEVSVEQEKTEERDVGKTILIILCVLLAAGMVAEGMILTDKLHKLEEERL